MAAILLTMMSQGFWAEGSDVLHDQIIISSRGEVKRNYRWVPYYLPGIY